MTAKDQKEANATYCVLATAEETTSLEAKRDWHQMAVTDVTTRLNTSLQGLTTEEAKQRLLQYGPNELFGNAGISPLKLLVANLFNAMNFIIFIAVVFSGAVLYDWIKVGILVFVIILNTGIGFVQEFRSEKTMEALKKMSSPIAKVKRNDNVDIIVCGDVVPGNTLEA
jgi:magnesium-transporting ATPase (P-type)